jgi:hypothetical protein
VLLAIAVVYEREGVGAQRDEEKVQVALEDDLLLCRVDKDALDVDHRLLHGRCRHRPQHGADSPAVDSKGLAETAGERATACGDAWGVRLCGGCGGGRLRRTHPEGDATIGAQVEDSRRQRREGND